jgi:hypothetical protein
MKKQILIMAVLGFAACFAVPSVEAATAKDKLIQVMVGEQESAESNILKMWMTNKRGKEFEILMSDYVTREVRYRAMTGKDDKTSLLAAVNADHDNKATSPIELGRLLVLEYFKRKGVDLKSKRFVKGTYIIGINETPEEIKLEVKPD